MIRQESAANFNTMVKATKNNDLSVVSCRDAKGREFDVLCVLAMCPNGTYIYMPFGLMMTPSLYPLLNKLQPPDNLKGEWFWDDED